MPRTLLIAASLLSITTLTACSLTQHSGSTTSTLFASISTSSHPTVKNLEFIEQYAATNRFRAGQPTAIKIMPDSSAVLFLRSENGRSFKQDLWKFDVATKQEKLLLTADQLLGGKEENLTPEELARRERMRMSSRGIASYQISEDSKQLLIPMSGNLFLVEYASAVAGKPNVLQLTENGGNIDPQLSANGGMVAFVNEGALFVKATDNYERAKQAEATAVSPVANGNVSYGEAEFVAQEEMGRSHGFWWSPNSDAIAYQSTDTTGVEIFNIADASDPSKPAQTWPYPRAGTKNAEVRLFVRHFEGVGEIDYSSDPLGVVGPLLPPIEVRWNHATYPYLAKVTWQKYGPLTILVQNRTQTEQVLYAVDDKTGDTRELLREKDKAWINIQDDVPNWYRELPPGSDATPGDNMFLWLSEQSGGSSWQITTRGIDGKVLNQPSAMIGANAPLWSETERELLGLAGVSKDGLQRIFRTVSKRDLISMDLYYVDDLHVFPSPGSNHRLRWLRWNVPPNEPYTSDGIFSPDFLLWVHTLASPSISPSWNVYSWNSGDFTQPIGALQSKSEAPSISPRVEYSRIITGPEANQTQFPTAIIRPTNFDPSKKYPVLNFAYAGPHSNTVNANARAYLLHQWFADQGFIVVAIDGRGTPRRGRVWEREIKNNLIDAALEDHCNALDALCKKYPEMDRNRIGVSGWSFGGYFSAMATMRRPDVFKAGIAGAPVADWRDYDTHYTERYMGLPDEASKLTDGIPGNKAGYDASNVLTYCKDLTVPLLIIHGTADDNVYFTHSVKMADALTRAGKKFEFLPLAGQTHMVIQPALVKELNARMVEFFKRELGEPK